MAWLTSHPAALHRRFFVPSRDDLERDELEASMVGGDEEDTDEDEDEDEDENGMFQDDEDIAEEASLRTWMRLQHEVRRGSNGTLAWPVTT